MFPYETHFLSKPLQGEQLEEFFRLISSQLYPTQHLDEPGLRIPGRVCLARYRARSVFNTETIKSLLETRVASLAAR